MGVLLIVVAAVWGAGAGLVLPRAATILLVVSNPGWLVPYVACVVGAVVMVIHFSIMLWAFLRR